MTSRLCSILSIPSRLFTHFLRGRRIEHTDTSQTANIFDKFYLETIKYTNENGEWIYLVTSGMEKERKLWVWVNEHIDELHSKCEMNIREWEWAVIVDNQHIIGQSHRLLVVVVRVQLGQQRGKPLHLQQVQIRLCHLRLGREFKFRCWVIGLFELW